MKTTRKMLLGAPGLALLALPSAGCGKQAVAENPDTSAKSAAPVNAPAVVAASPEVREVAANPSAHLGRLTLSGVVGIVAPQKGFVLVDRKEYQGEGLACLNTDEPTKVSVQWSGAPPKVKDTVQVQGQLAKGAKGYEFTAEKVVKQ